MADMPESCARVARLILDGVTSCGGATVPVKERAKVPTYGFMVGGAVPELVVPWIDKESLWNLSTRDRRERLYQAAGQFAQENWLRITAYPGFRAIGAWVNQETGYVHLDVSDWFASLTIALDTARGRKELAVYDIRHGNAIPVISASA